MAKEIDLDSLGQVIGAALAQGIAATQPPRELREGDPEYVARQQAEGWFDTFEKPVYQNAYEAQARGLSPEVRWRAARLVSGKYLRGRVTVEADDTSVRLKYPVSGDAMLINRDYFRDFSDLITKIWDEQTVGHA